MNYIVVSRVCCSVCCSMCLYIIWIMLSCVLQCVLQCVSLPYFTCGVLMCVSLSVWLRCTCVAVYVPESHHLCCSVCCSVCRYIVSRVVSWCVCVANFGVRVLQSVYLHHMNHVVLIRVCCRVYLKRKYTTCGVLMRVCVWVLFMCVAVCVSVSYQSCCRDLRVLQCLSQNHVTYGVLMCVYVWVLCTCVAVCASTSYQLCCHDLCVLQCRSQKHVCLAVYISKCVAVYASISYEVALVSRID